MISRRKKNNFIKLFLINIKYQHDYLKEGLDKPFTPFKLKINERSLHTQIRHVIELYTPFVKNVPYLGTERILMNILYEKRIWELFVMEINR